MITTIIHILSYFFMAIGLGFCSIGVLGLFRMPDLFARQHATGLIDTMGFLCICISLALYSGLSIISIKILLLGALAAFLSAPTCTMLVKSAILCKIIKKNNKDHTC